MFDHSFSIAFGAGIISFFAPCVLPLLPSYIGYIVGVSVGDLKGSDYSVFRKKILQSSLFYILGFSLIFVALGTTAAGIGITLRQYGDLLRRLGGLVFLILGLDLVGVLKLPFSKSVKQLKLPVFAEKVGPLRSFFVGLVFATVWAPCVGPVLGSILALAATSPTAGVGAAMLFVYSLGISLPFLVVSLMLASAPKHMKIVGKHVETILKIAGVLLIVFGVLLLTDTFKYVYAVSLRLFYY